MTYIRKTRDIFDVQGDYGQGWETVTAAETRKEASQFIRDYRVNEPGIPFRIKTVREPIR